MFNKGAQVIIYTIILGSWVSRTEAFWPQLLKDFENIPASVQDLPLDYDPTNGEEFEYVVVGAGAAGAAAASRLALAGHRTLLLEAGPDPDPLTWVPAAAQGMLGSQMDWAYTTISNNKSCLSSVDQQCRFSRGKCLGGSTSINYMMYVRGNRNDYNYNIPGWSWAELEPYFLRYEALRSELPASSKPYHNKTGIMNVQFFADSENDWHGRLFEGYNYLSFPNNADVNAKSQVGISQVIGYTYKGFRMSTAKAYLTNDEVKSKLKVTKNSFCTGLLWKDSDKPTVRGVKFQKDGKTLTVQATKSVVLSAGTVGTPVILQQSGIGPASLLSAVNITVRADLPVGQSMSDHVLPLIFVKVDKNIFAESADVTQASVDAARYLLKQEGQFASNGLTDVTVLLNTKCYDFVHKILLNNSTECEEPTMQIVHAYIERGLIPLGAPLVKQSINFKSNIINQLSKANAKASLIIFSLVVLQPESRGWVRVTSRNPTDPPSIFPNYLGETADVEEMLRGIKILQDLIKTPVFKEHNAEILELDLNCGEMEYWECYVRHMTFSVFHAAGTAQVGGVTDAAQRVVGVAGLRIADLSLLQKVPRGNTAAVSIVMGERVAELLLNYFTTNSTKAATTN